jgi:hypothetical protein
MKQLERFRLISGSRPIVGRVVVNSYRKTQMKNNVKVQDFGQTLVDPSETIRRKIARYTSAQYPRAVFCASCLGYSLY